MTTLIFVRHGQSVANQEKIFTGHSNVALTELGHTQAQRTAEYLDRYSFDHIYSSDLLRSHQTAEHTARRQGKEIIDDRVFREIYAGDWEGRKFTEIIEQYPETHEVWKHHITRSRPDGGESVRELYTRFWGGVKEVLGRHRGETVAIFTHATPIRAMSWQWFGYDILTANEEILDRADAIGFCSNASVSVVEYSDDDQPHLVCFSYDEHLQDCATTLPKDLV